MMMMKKRSVPSTPVPLSVETDIKETNNPNMALKYGQSTPGTMATTPKIVSPIGIFSRWTRMGDAGISSSESETDSVSLITTKSRLGIQRPKYREDDDMSKQSSKSARIGIERTAYMLPEGDIPLSPLNLYLDKKGTISPPNLIAVDNTESPASPWTPSPRDIHTPAGHQQRLFDDTESAQASDDDSIERMVHKQTAEGHYLLNSHSLTSPNENVRFSLTKGRRGMPSAMRRACDQVLRKGQAERFPVKTGIRDMDASFKIFLLLLNPKAKIFELIQLIYSPSSTAIGTILEMIPDNSTEPALGSQEYVGLCRPKDGIAIMDTELMASGSNCKISCARITRGEILVAIPSGYIGSQVATLATPILANPRIVKLLKKSDPLAARRNKVRRRSSTRGRSRGRSRLNKTIQVVETVREENSEDDLSMDGEMHRAMEHAMQVAAAANSGIPDEDQASTLSQQTTGSVIADDEDYDDDERPSLSRAPSSDMEDSVATSYHSTGNYSSTVKSYAEMTRASDFHTAAGYQSSTSTYLSDSSTMMGLQHDNEIFSFQSGTKRRMRRRNNNTRRRDRRSQRNAYVLRIGCAAAAYMVFRYLTDSLEEQEDNDLDDEEQTFGHPMGILGLIQVLVLLLGLAKLQIYVDKQTREPTPRSI